MNGGEGSRLLSLEDALALSAQEVIAAPPDADGTVNEDPTVIEGSTLGRNTLGSSLGITNAGPVD